MWDVSLSQRVVSNAEQSNTENRKKKKKKENSWRSIKIERIARDGRWRNSVWTDFFEN